MALILGLTGGSIIVVGLAAEWLAHGTRLGFAAQRDLLTGWLIGAIGLVAWARVPRSRIGPLLIVAGLTWYWAPSPILDPLGPARGRPHVRVRRRARPRALHVADRSRPRPVRSRRHHRRVPRDALSAAVGARRRAAGHRYPAGRGPRRAVAGPAAAPATGARAAILVGLGLALVLASKGLVAGVLRRQGVAYPGDPEALWQIALVIAAADLAWSLIALERRRRTVTDLVVSLGAEGSLDRAVDLAAAAGLPDESSIADALSRAAEMAERNRTLQVELSAQAMALGGVTSPPAGGRGRRNAKRLRCACARDLAPASPGFHARLAGARGAEWPSCIGARPGARLDRALTQLHAGLDELDELARGLEIVHSSGSAGSQTPWSTLAGRSPVPVVVTLPSRIEGAGPECGANALLRGIRGARQRRLKACSVQVALWLGP